MIVTDKKFKNYLVIKNNIQKFKPFKDYFENRNFSNTYLRLFQSRIRAVPFYNNTFSLKCFSTLFRALWLVL